MKTRAALAIIIAVTFTLLSLMSCGTDTSFFALTQEEADDQAQGIEGSHGTLEDLDQLCKVAEAAGLSLKVDICHMGSVESNISCSALPSHLAHSSLDNAGSCI